MDGQGKLERTWKVREKSRNLKINGYRWQAVFRKFKMSGKKSGKSWGILKGMISGNPGPTKLADRVISLYEAEIFQMWFRCMHTTNTMIILQ